MSDLKQTPAIINKVHIWKHDSGNLVAQVILRLGSNTYQSTPAYFCRPNSNALTVFLGALLDLTGVKSLADLKDSHVYVLHEQGAEDVLIVGLAPFLSSDGKAFLLSDLESRFRTCQTETDTEQS